MSEFSADARPVLIGSLPHTSHQEAVDLIFDYTPQIPLWPQLPHNKKEGMLLQFLPGMPGVTEKDDKIFIDVEGPDFEAQFLSFYEEYIMVTEGGAGLEDSRFSMSNDEAAGFFTFLEKAKKESDQLLGLKGQLTGPITFCTGLVDQDGKALFYNEQIRDAAVKLLALKAQWQTRKMAEIKPTPLVFFDEPGLAGLGSSAFITITPEDIHNCFSEVFSAVRQEGGLTGVHVCANTEWPIIFESGVDIVSFDAFSYFDKLVLYPEQLRSFFGRGGILASGIVPTTTDFIESVDSEGLTRKWLDQAAQLEEIGIAREVIKAQTLITPSCGTGTISEELAVRVLELTRDVSRLVQERYTTGD